MSSFATFFASAVRAPDRSARFSRQATCFGFFVFRIFVSTMQVLGGCFSCAGDSPSPSVKCRTRPDASLCAGPLTLFANSGESRTTTPAEGFFWRSPNSSIARPCCLMLVQLLPDICTCPRVLICYSQFVELYGPLIGGRCQHVLGDFCDHDKHCSNLHH